MCPPEAGFMPKYGENLVISVKFLHPFKMSVDATRFLTGHLSTGKDKNMGSFNSNQEAKNVELGVLVFFLCSETL